MTTTKRFTVMTLVFAIVAMLVFAGIMSVGLSPRETAFADYPITYLDENSTEHTCTNYTVISADTTTWTDGWYVADGDLEINTTVTLDGAVNVILKDGAWLNIQDVDNGIVGSNSSLTIYAQSKGDSVGKFCVETALYTGNNGLVLASLTINGGNISLGGNVIAIHISSGTGDVTINGGKVHISGGWRYGIAHFGEGGVRINGGEVVVYGSQGAIRTSNADDSATRAAVFNTIPGTGWTDYRGDEGETAFPANAEGKELSGFRKVEFLGNSEPVHTHNYSTDWSYDDTNHWHACTADGECDIPKADEAAHTYGDDINETGYYHCSICGYENTTKKAEYDEAQQGGADPDPDPDPTPDPTDPIDPTDPTEPVTPHEKQENPITVTISDWGYGQDPSTPVVKGNKSSVQPTFTYKVRGTDDSTFTATVPTAIGEYVIKAYVAENDDYFASYATNEFAITWKLSSDTGVSVIIDDEDYDANIRLEVEVKTEVYSQESQDKHEKITVEFLEENESIALIYAVKLKRLTIIGDQQTLEDIQPSDIKPGTQITVAMAVPEELRGKSFKALHVHSVNDIEYVPYTVSANGEYIYVHTDRLSDFAFVVASASVVADTSFTHHCIGWITILLCILTVILLIVFFALKLMDKKWAKLTALILAGVAVLVGLIILCVHPCIVSLMGFILAIVLLVLVLFLLFLQKKKEEKDKDKKEEKTEDEEQDEEENAKTVEKTDEKEAEKADVNNAERSLGQEVRGAISAAVEDNSSKTADEKIVAAAADSVSDKKASGIGLKEALAMAAVATRAEKITKKYVADYLDNRFGDDVETNRRGNLTSTGLPLADTHYVLCGKKKQCFAFVYEVNDIVMMQLKMTDDLGQEYAKDHETVRLSAFPKSKDTWYSVIIDDSFTNDDVHRLLDDCFLQNKERLTQ